MKTYDVHNLNRIELSGDSVNEQEYSAVHVDKLLVEISRLYLERCKAMKDDNTIAIHLTTLRIAALRAQLNNSNLSRTPSGQPWLLPEAP